MFNYYCRIWIRAKYSHPKDILHFIENTRKNWVNNPFLRRQITALISRTIPFRMDSSVNLLNQQISSGFSDTVSLASHILMDIEADEFCDFIEIH